MASSAAPSVRPPRPKKEPQALVIPKNAAEEQKLKLERLMKNPVRRGAGSKPLWVPPLNAPAPLGPGPTSSASKLWTAIPESQRQTLGRSRPPPR